MSEGERMKQVNTLSNRRKPEELYLTEIKGILDNGHLVKGAKLPSVIMFPHISRAGRIVAKGDQVTVYDYMDGSKEVDIEDGVKEAILNSIKSLEPLESGKQYWLYSGGDLHLEYSK